VAEEYATDGFFEKGIALLRKVQKLVPMDENLPQKIEKIWERKRIEQVREQALQGLRESLGGGGESGASVLELEGLWGKLLRSVVVRRLDGPQLRHLFSCMTLERRERGDVLAERNSDLQALFLIARGRVEASASVGGGKPVQLRTFGSGDLVGEASVLEQKPWPASYVAMDNLTLLQLTREGLEKALQGNPDPRGLLDALREQQHDRAVSMAIHQLSR
jgi:Cyclic nucleotide-binding domain